MWSYIARRLLIMIPTLFGITIVSFLIMQLAPGDPLLNKLGPAGAGSSANTREQYMIQKRDLKLDKPILLNFRYFQDYSRDIAAAAHFRSRTVPEIQSELAQMAQSPDASEDARRLIGFLRSLKIRSFDERLKDGLKEESTEHHDLALAIDAHAQIYCEDAGVHGVPPAIEILKTSKDRRLKIGAMRCLTSMVLDPFVYTYSKDPKPAETPDVVSTWKTWWERDKARFPSPSPQRQEVVRRKISDLAKASRKQLLEGLEEFVRSDAPVFIEMLLGDTTLREKVVSSLALIQHVGKPLKVDVSLEAAEKKVDEVAQNWLAYYETRNTEYDPGLLIKALRIFTDTQYAHMVWRLITLDFGRSALGTHDPVGQKIWEAFKVSAPLMILAEMLIYLLAVPLGIFCAVKKGRWQDRSISLGLFVLYSIPGFIAGMLFLEFLCYGDFLKLFPYDGLHGQGAENFAAGQYWLDYLRHVVLPVICLGLFGLAGLAMYSRTSMLDVINQDYIRTARAKGLPGHKVVLKHGLRNALIPIITLFASFIPAMLGGSVLIEVLFNIPGMGRLSFTSVQEKDIPTLMALIYIEAIVVMISILISDILYAFVDPRISFEGRSKAA